MAGSFNQICIVSWGFPGGSNGKESARNAGDPGWNYITFREEKTEAQRE